MVPKNTNFVVVCQGWQCLNSQNNWCSHPSLYPSVMQAHFRVLICLFLEIFGFWLGFVERPHFSQSRFIIFFVWSRARSIFFIYPTTVKRLQGYKTISIRLKVSVSSNHHLDLMTHGLQSQKSQSQNVPFSDRYRTVPARFPIALLVEAVPWVSN